METTTEKRIKTGGRKKGTPNKITASMKYMFKALIMNNYDIVEDAFMKAKPKEQLNFHIPFCIILVFVPFWEM